MGIFEPSRPLPPLLISQPRVAMASGEAIDLCSSNPNPKSNSVGSLRSPPGSKCGSERMVEMELDAARALADFARTALIESRAEDGGGSRAKKRIKNESPDEEICESRHACLEDDDHRDKKASVNVLNERINGCQDAELSKLSSNCSDSHATCFGRKTKQSLTEAEREARRIRRVLANRESARQTIRRRQALREELTKRVADLSLDNENMKMEKELVMRKYISLKDKNKQLKEQMAISVKCKVELGGKIAPTQVEAATSPSTELSLVTHRETPFVPYMWPAWPSNSSNNFSSYADGDPHRINGSRRLFYVSPRAWFYPLLQRTSESCPPDSQQCGDPDAGSFDKRHGLPCSLKAETNKERDLLHDRSKVGDSLVMTRAMEKDNRVTSLLEMPAGFSTNNQVSKSDPDEVPLTLSLSATSSSSLKDVAAIDIDIEKMRDLTEKILPEKPVPSLHLSKKMVNTVTAAEARKRRKELTKLKHLGRQAGLQC